MHKLLEQFGLRSYTSTPFCAVVASIWGILGSSLCVLGSNLAPTWRPRSLQSRPRAHKSCPREPKIVQEPPKTAQEPPKSRPRCPGAAQDLTRAPPRSCQEPGPNPRITHDLKRTPNFTTQSFRTSVHATKRLKSKTSGGGTPPRGSSIKS